jgi:hypothetical protein
MSTEYFTKKKKKTKNQKTQYTFFSAVHGTFFKTDHILQHKASHSNIRK